MRSGIITATILALPAVIAMPCTASADGTGPAGLRIGWASADITPKQPIVMSGGRRARISTGVMSPIGVTALVLESVDKDGKTVELVAQAAIEVSSLREDVMRFILEKMGERIPEIAPEKLIVFATHTHAAPDSRPAPVLAKKLAALGIEVAPAWTWWGMDLGVTPTPRDYAELVTERVVDAVEQALANRKPGGVSFGLGHAVAGHNRLARYDSGRSQMYGKTNRADFDHIEGYEDHSVGLLFTYDAGGELTGVVVNIACSAQVNEGGTLISADYWHETRNELRKRLGASLYVLPQIAAAGDQSPHLLWNKAAEKRMQKITGRNQREEIAVRIADAVSSVLPYMKDHIDCSPVLAHRLEQVALTRRRITEQDFDRARKNFDRLLAQYLKMRQEIEEKPELKQKARWYNDITPIYWDMRRVYRRVIAAYELQQVKVSVPVHVVRIGDLAIATSPFELYLDYGMRIKARSKAVQTFTIELANGCCGYLPTERSVAGGAYGAIPESNEVGPEGGQELVERTLQLIDSLWAEK